MVRISRLLILLVLVALVASAGQAVHAQPVQAPTAPQSVVIDAVGPSTAKDPTQAKAENEFRAVALARERAYYAEDYEHFASFLADNVIAVQPGAPEKVGKAALVKGIKAFWAANDTIGKFTLKRIWVSGNYATRYGEWDEMVTPTAGGKPVHQIGRCFVGWQKINNEWKIVSSFVNFLMDPTELQ